MSATQFAMVGSTRCSVSHQFLFYFYFFVYRTEAETARLQKQVEELASLIKDNLHSKHLVLSTEEALIAILQQHQQCREDEDDDGEQDSATSHRASARQRLPPPSLALPRRHLWVQLIVPLRSNLICSVIADFTL
uniref:Uncharacterized protein n=1 Tax=Arundo donax TaxID=35708 RepID=A0A0A9F0S5_ARUDO